MKNIRLRAKYALVVLTMGEKATANLAQRFPEENLIMKNCRGGSFGLNFHQVLSEYLQSDVDFLILIDGDIYPIFNLGLIRHFLISFIWVLQRDVVIFGRVERFSSAALFAYGGIRVYNLRKLSLYRDLTFFDSAKRPETKFIKENSLRSLKTRFPLVLHEFFLRPSEARARALQRRGKSLNERSLRVMSINMSNTETAYNRALKRGQTIDGTKYCTDEFEEAETYNFKFYVRFLFCRVFQCYQK